MIEKLNNALADEYEVPISEILPESDIWQTLNLDSMRAMQIIIIIKQLFGVLIKPHVLQRMVTFADLYELILEKYQMTI